MRVIALRGHRHSGFLLLALNPSKRYHITHLPVEVEVLTRKANALRLDELRGLTTERENRINLRDSASIINIRPAKVAPIAL